MFPAIVLAALSPAFAGGCKSTYYATMEKFGKHKRDLLVDRVEEARVDQEEAKQQFRTALDRFGDVVALKNTELKATHDALKAELDQCQRKAADVTGRVDAVEQVATDLFREWNAELEQYSSADLRRASEQQLEQTRQRYDRLMGAMRRAEQSMQPVLGSFRDHVLFLKHNLNAQAIASLQGELDSLQDDTAALIKQMEAAIEEADVFIRKMRSEA
jgi:hypothetical protein